MDKLRVIDRSTGKVIQPEILETTSTGEPYVKFDVTQVAGRHILMDSRCENADDFMRTLVVADAIFRAHAINVSLCMPYIPGSRQDHVGAASGEALTASIYANLINSVGFCEVLIVDPHSDVTPALISNAIVISAYDLAMKFFKPEQFDFVICPRIGSEKRAMYFAKALGDVPVIYPVETANLSQGKYLVVDDICDDGKQFIRIGEKFHEKVNGDANFEISMFASHGIFSGGIDSLFLAGYSHVYTTDSIVDCPTVPMYEGNEDYVTVFPINTPKE